MKPCAFDMKTLIYCLFGVVIGKRTVARGVGWLALAVLLALGVGCKSTGLTGTIQTPPVEYVK